MRRFRFRRKTVGKKTAVRFIAAFLCFAVLVFCYYQRIRPLILRCAVSQAESMFLAAADRAVVQVLAEENIRYEDIVLLARNTDGAVTSVQTDIVKINTLKSRISDTLADIIEQKEFYDVQIPLGSFLFPSLTDAWGPKIRFRMQLTATARVNFSHEFKSEGINQVLHCVMVDMEIGGSLIILGHSRSLNAATSIFAAQTLIVGSVPGAFTEVNQGAAQDIAGTINDYGANLNK